MLVNIFSYFANARTSPCHIYRNSGSFSTFYSFLMIMSNSVTFLDKSISSYMLFATKPTALTRIAAQLPRLLYGLGSSDINRCEKYPQ